MKNNLYLSLSESGIENSTSDGVTNDLYCTNTKLYMRIWCDNGHDDIRPLRCHNCPNCWQVRKNRFVKQCMLRYEENVIAPGAKNEITLWTLGSDKDDNPENRKWIVDCFSKLRVLLFKIIPEMDLPHPFDPLVYVIEKGKGKTSEGKLHIHFVNNGVKLSQLYVLRLWSYITWHHAPNVNFSRLKECKKCGWTQDYYKSPKKCLRSGCSSTNWIVPEYTRTFLYISKYLGKSKKTRNYYWLGKMRVLKDKEKYKMVCSIKLLNDKRCGGSIWLIELGTMDDSDRFDPTVLLPQKGSRKYYDLQEVY